MKKLVASLILAGMASAPALAQNPVYAGVQLGDGYVGALAGVQVSEAWSVEGHYNKIDTGNDYFGNDVSAHTLGVAGVYTHKLKVNDMPGLSVFGNIGVDRATVKINGESASDTELTLGGGLQYDFNNKFRARLGIDIEGPSDSLYVAGIFKF